MNKFVEKPLLTENQKKYASTEWGNFKFKGFIEIPFDSAFSYYCFNQLDIDFEEPEEKYKMYLSVLTGKKESMMENEKNEIKEYINSVVKTFNKDTSTNEKIEFNEVKELLFPEIDLENFSFEMPYIVFFRGCDDGSWFYRFKTEKECEDFIQSILNYNGDLSDFFYPESSIFEKNIYKFHYN
jgi:hypothetical protein